MLFETMSQEFKAQGTQYQVLPTFGICCRELMGLTVTSFRACVRSFCSVGQSNRKCSGSSILSFVGHIGFMVSLKL